MSAIAFMVVAAMQVGNAAPMVRPPQRIRNPKQIVAKGPPPVQKIVEIEELARAKPWKFTDTGALRLPSGEARNVSCTRNDERHFSCRYQMRFAAYGETRFGSWIERRKVYVLGGEGWLMLNGERYCANLTARPLPSACFKDREP